MSILLDTQTGNRNLRDGTTPALAYTMLANGDVRVNIYAGTFAKPCVGIEGIWQLYAKVIRGGLTYWTEPFPQLYAASASNYKLFTSKTIEAKTNDIIQVILYSPNVGDTEVTVTAEIWHVSGALTTLQAATDAIQAVTDVIPDAGALTTLQAAVDALVAPVNIDNNGIVITNEDITP